MILGQSRQTGHVEERQKIPQGGNTGERSKRGAVNTGPSWGLGRVYPKDWNASLKKDDAGKNNFILGLLRIG